MTHLKAKNPFEQYKFDDVQKAMGGGFKKPNDKEKPQYMNEDLIFKIMSNPKLAGAF
jgi:hypothetical protein